MNYFVTTWLAVDPCPIVTDPGWLTGPKATVMAAVIAVSGAVVAYLGVTKQTRTTQREYRRAEKILVLSNAWTAAVKYSRALERVNKVSYSAERVAKVNEMSAGPMWDLSDEYVVAVTKLPIYKFGVAFAALAKLHAANIVIWDALRAHPTDVADETRATLLYNSAERAIKEAVEGLD